MDICNTPSPSVSCIAHSASTNSLLRSPDLQFQILDEVARMTLQEAPLQTPYQTPVTRKREPSCVTPPRQNVVDKVEHRMTVPSLFGGKTNSNGSKDNSAYRRCQRKKAWGLLPAPMLPNSPELDAGVGHNPYSQHWPIYSPVFRVGTVNIEFVSTNDEGNVVQPVSAPTRSRVQPVPHTFFPTLLEGFDASRPSSRRKILKMRRRDDEIRLLHAAAL